MHDSIRKLRKDFSGILFSKIRKIRLILLAKISTFAVYFEAKLKNIKIGKNCIFWSRVIMYRAPFSSITIADNCKFRSDSSSNLIGLNHKCNLVTLRKDANIEIGMNCGFSGTIIGAARRIFIGNDVLCGANTIITDTDWHPVNNNDRVNKNYAEADPVIIEDNVWLGVNVVVLKGVRIGRNTVIGANSLVTRDIPSNVIAAGNPCKIIRKLEKV